MIYTMEELKKQILLVAQKYEIPAVYLFGSYARGQATKDSDVDVLIQITGMKIRPWVWGAIYEELSQRLHKKIHLLTVEQLEQDGRNSWEQKLINRIQQEKILTYKSEKLSKGEGFMSHNKELVPSNIRIDADMEIDDTGQTITAYIGAPEMEGPQ